MSGEKKRGSGQTKVGVVVSKSGAKTVKVRVERMVKHPIYKRYVRSTKGFLAHDEREECQLGDRVEIVETRPLSARKCWRVRRVMIRPQEPVTGAAAVESEG